MKMFVGDKEIVGAGDWSFSNLTKKQERYFTLVFEYGRLMFIKEKYGILKDDEWRLLDSVTNELRNLPHKRQE